MTTVGMIGLGVMGLAMAQNLMRAGFQVAGYDVDASRQDLLRASQGTVCRSVQAVAKIGRAHV